jgi:hypothetical protein
MMVEIGKTDLIGEGRLAMEIFEQNRGYHGVDVSKLALEHAAPTTRFVYTSLSTLATLMERRIGTELTTYG